MEKDELEKEDEYVDVDIEEIVTTTKYLQGKPIETITKYKYKEN